MSQDTIFLDCGFVGGYGLLGRHALKVYHLGRAVAVSPAFDADDE